MNHGRYQLYHILLSEKILCTLRFLLLFHYIRKKKVNFFSSFESWRFRLSIDVLKHKGPLRPISYKRSQD